MEVYSLFIAEFNKKSLLREAVSSILKIFFVLSCVILIASGCNKSKPFKLSFAPDSSVYADQNFSDLVLDSTEVISFFKQNPLPNNLSNQVVEFYTNRNYQLGWFNQTGLTCAAPNFYNQLQSYNRDFADNSLNNNELDTLMKAVEGDEIHFMSQVKQVQELDLLLTTTFFRFAQKVYGGTTKNPSNLEWYIPRKKKNYQILLDSLVSSALCEKMQEPVNQYYIRLKEKLRQYRIIQKNGGLPIIITHKKSLTVGDFDSCLVNLKQHLLLTGDLKINDQNFSFTDTLSKAVINFQGRMGLVENGMIDLNTITELNRPIEFRIKQIMINLERLRWVPVEMENNYLLINIPEFKLHIFEDGKQLWATNVVVGQTVTKTSIFRGNLSQIILNPYWGVPTSIVRKEVLPKLKQNPNYLERNNMEVLSGNQVINPNDINWNKYGESVPYDFRQKPGKNNSLGKMKFMFPNNYHIYLHDTPAKNLFGDTKRAFSHGCIRVENPKKLALFLLRNDGNWSDEKVDKVLETDEQTGIRINPTVPVYIAYFTAWVDNKGQLNFRNDLYNLDKKLSKEVFGE